MLQLPGMESLRLIHFQETKRLLIDQSNINIVRFDSTTYETPVFDT